MPLFAPIPDAQETARRQLLGTINRFERPKHRGRPLTWNHVAGAAFHARRAGVPEAIIQAELDAARRRAEERARST